MFKQRIAYQCKRAGGGEGGVISGDHGFECVSGKAVGQRGEVPIGHLFFSSQRRGGRVPLLGFEEVKVLGAEILLRDES